MAAKTVLVATEAYTRILSKKVLLEYSINDFNIEQTWLPRERLDQFDTNHPSGKVYVIGQAPGDIGAMSRKPNLTLGTHSVQVGYQRRVDASNTSLVNDCIELVEQLDDTLRNEFDLTGYEWTSREYLKDVETDLPFSFIGLRENAVFEAYFTSFYNNVKTPAP